jgi:hypothetical protein
MGYERWLRDHLIKKQAPDHNQITKQLNRASIVGFSIFPDTLERE